MPPRNPGTNFRAKIPNGRRVKKETEANGKLVTKIESVFADPTDFSPMK